MIQIQGSLYNLIYKSKTFFKNAQYFHIVMTVCMFGTGVAGVILSDGSDGTAQVPYFFTGFIAGAWHIAFIVLGQVCMYYLSGNGSHGSRASMLVHGYSIVCSVFVLFNVMGVVFTVVNGICIENMMCYYDKNHMSNRMMAILLILEHCVSILASIFFAKRSHLIDSELSADTAIKINHHFDFLRIRTRELSQSESPRSHQSNSDELNEHALTEVHSKGGHVLTTIEISAMTHKKTHRRSKSQPNMVKELGLKPPEVEGHVFSIYSDSEMKAEKVEGRKKKRRFIPSKAKSNRIKAKIEINTGRRRRSKSEGNEIGYVSSSEECSSNFGTPRISVEERHKQLSQLEEGRRTTAPLSELDSGEADDSFNVKPGRSTEQIDTQQELLKRQAKLQKEQEKLLMEQRKLFQVQQSTLERPPPYESWNSRESSGSECSAGESEYSGTILHVEATEDNDYTDV